MKISREVRSLLPDRCAGHILYAAIGVRRLRGGRAHLYTPLPPQHPLARFNRPPSFAVAEEAAAADERMRVARADPAVPPRGHSVADILDQRLRPAADRRDRAVIARANSLEREHNQLVALWMPRYLDPGMPFWRTPVIRGATETEPPVLVYEELHRDVFPHLDGPKDPRCGQWDHDEQGRRHTDHPMSRREEEAFYIARARDERARQVARAARLRSASRRKFVRRLRLAEAWWASFYTALRATTEHLDVPTNARIDFVAVQQHVVVLVMNSEMFLRGVSKAMKAAKGSSDPLIAFQLLEAALDTTDTVLEYVHAAVGVARTAQYVTPSYRRRLLHRRRMYIEQALSYGRRVALHNIAWISAYLPADNANEDQVQAESAVVHDSDTSSDIENVQPVAMGGVAE